YEDQSRICISELGIGVDQLPNKLMLLRIEAATGQMEHHRVAPLQLRQRPPPAGLIGQLVVGERPAFTDVAAHLASKLERVWSIDPIEIQRIQNARHGSPDPTWAQPVRWQDRSR